MCPPARVPMPTPKAPVRGRWEVIAASLPGCHLQCCSDLSSDLCISAPPDTVAPSSSLLSHLPRALVATAHTSQLRPRACLNTRSEAAPTPDSTARELSLSLLRQHTTTSRDHARSQFWSSKTTADSRALSLPRFKNPPPSPAPPPPPSTPPLEDSPSPLASPAGRRSRAGCVLA